MRAHTSGVEASGGLVLDADGAMGQVAGHSGATGDGDARRGCYLVVSPCAHAGILEPSVFTPSVPPRLERSALSAAHAATPCAAGLRHAAIGHNPVAFRCPVPGD